MIHINLSAEKTLRYKLSDVDKVTSVALVICFENNVVYRYNGFIDKETNEAVVNLPVLQKIIKDGVEATCYLEVFLDSDSYYKVASDSIIFKHYENINIEFKELSDVLKAELLTRNEVSLDMSTIARTKVSYKRK